MRPNPCSLEFGKVPMLQESYYIWVTNRFVQTLQLVSIEEEEEKEKKKKLRITTTTNQAIFLK